MELFDKWLLLIWVISSTAFIVAMAMGIGQEK